MRLPWKDCLGSPVPPSILPALRLLLDEAYFRPIEANEAATQVGVVSRRVVGETMRIDTVDLRSPELSAAAEAATKMKRCSPYAENLAVCGPLSVL